MQVAQQGEQLASTEDVEHHHCHTINLPHAVLRDLNTEGDDKRCGLHGTEYVQMPQAKDNSYLKQTDTPQNETTVSKVTGLEDIGNKMYVSESEVPDELVKYWKQRYRLFHKFDEGIQLDEEGWFSVTPERIAIEIAKRFKGMSIVLDMFCGCGGNTIQFARNGSIVIGIDNNRDRIAMAQNNARVYGIDQYVDFIQGDVYEVIPTVNTRVSAIDAIFISPPWGGPSYLNTGAYDVSVFKRVVDEARRITPNIAILIPRNVEYQNVFDTFGPCEVQRNCLSGKVKTQTLYFGSLISNVTNDVNVLDLEPTSTMLNVDEPLRKRKRVRKRKSRGSKRRKRNTLG